MKVLIHLIGHYIGANFDFCIFLYIRFTLFCIYITPQHKVIKLNLSRDQFLSWTFILFCFFSCCFLLSSMGLWVCVSPLLGRVMEMWVMQWGGV